MSDCAHVRDLMLEAEPASLLGSGDDPVAAHVRTCPACAALARIVLEETAALDRFLANAGPVDAEALVEAAWDAPPRAKRITPRRHWLGWAAAAAVAGLLFVRGDRPLPFTPSVAPQGPPPLVEPAPGQNVAVLATDNPDITVLWFYP